MKHDLMKLKAPNKPLQKLWSRWAPVGWERKATVTGAIHQRQRGIDWMRVEKAWHGTYGHPCWAKWVSYERTTSTQPNQGRSQAEWLHTSVHPADIPEVVWLKEGIVRSWRLDSTLRGCLHSLLWVGFKLIGQTYWTSCIFSSKTAQLP